MFEALDPKVLPNKNDPQDPRFEKVIGASAPWNVSIQGYPDDEGISLNGGRPGAAKAPDAIRAAFYKMTPWFPLQNANFSIQDLGNLRVTQLDLHERHREAHRSTKNQLDQKNFLISLGGGHDYGFSDAAGFLDHHLQKKKIRPLVINFDAHLDVRPANETHHSGTPFRRLIETYGHRFDFVEVGLQPQCNSIHHWNWLLEKKGSIIPIDLIEKKGMLSALKKTLAKIPKQTPLWISVDIDGFHQAEAPGCSQSWNRGFTLREFLPALEFLIQKFQLSGFGIYEVSPPLDLDGRTSKLAALIMYESLRFQSMKLTPASWGKRR